MLVDPDLGISDDIEDGDAAAPVNIGADRGDASKEDLNGARVFKDEGEE